MRYTLISQFIGQVLKLNPCSKPSEAPSHPYLTELLCHCGRSETGHRSWNLLHHSFSVGTGWWIFHEGHAEAWCSTEHVVHIGMLCGSPACVRGRWAFWEKRELVWAMGPVRSAQSKACFLMRKTVNPSVHCSFLSNHYFLFITRPSWVKGFSSCHFPDAP